MSIAEGYAAVDPEGEIFVRTVSPTLRGARVNWLVTVARVMVIASATDNEIEDSFRRWSREIKADIRRVRITTIEDA